MNKVLPAKMDVVESPALLVVADQLVQPVTLEWMRKRVKMAPTVYQELQEFQG